MMDLDSIPPPPILDLSTFFKPLPYILIEVDGVLQLAKIDAIPDIHVLVTMIIDLQVAIMT